MIYLALFFAGAFLANAIPHIVKGVVGERFPTPFARMGGKTDSGPLVNFLWGTLNLVLALVLVVRNPFVLGLNVQTGVFAAGFLVLGVFAAVEFGRWQAKRVAGK